MTKKSLEELEMRGDFIRRHIGPDRHQIGEMLQSLNLDTLEDIITRAVPESIISKEPLALTETISERTVITHLRKMRDRNQVFTSMLGMGYHGTVTPAVIKRNVLENPAWYRLRLRYERRHYAGQAQRNIPDRLL